MTNLKNKSELNLEAANKLHELSYYPSVIHCAYYACFQLAKYKLLTACGLSEAELMPQRKPAGTPAPEGSHERLISQTVQQLRLVGKDSATKFNQLMMELKKMRHESDYSDAIIDFNKSRNALNKSSELIAVIRKLN